MAPNAASKLSLIEQSQHNESSDEIKSTLRSLLESQEITQRQISKFTSFSASVISQALDNKYEGDAEKIDDALARFYRNWIATNAIIETSVVREIHATMMLSWKRKEICRITGPFGWGKSKAASRFVLEHDDFATYVELTSTTTPTSIIHRIAESLNIESQMTGSADDKLFAIIRALQRKPRLLVIDEADNLKPRTLAILKDIHGGDATERCAIVLIGTDTLKKVLQDPELGYLQSRIRIKRQIAAITFDEAKKIADMWPHKLDRDELKKAWAWALKTHGIRSLVALLARAYDEMQMANKKKIDSDCLEAGYGWLMD
jgi:DNA transposition AAA+ family ATPase